MKARIWTCALLVVAACGGDDRADGVSAAAIEAWGLGSSGRRTAAIEDVAPMCETVIVFAIDRVAKSELPLAPAGSSAAEDPDDRDAQVTPRLDAVAAGGDVVPDAITTSSGGNAALASLLTGLVPTEHGVGTLRDLGRTALGPGPATLQGALQRAGWSTIASLSSPRHARGFSGFARGFDDYAAPRVGERPRDAGAVVNGARMSLSDALRAKRKVFALYAFASPGDRAVGGTLEPERVAPFVAARLEPFRDRSAEVDAALQRMAKDPRAALDDLDELLGRARGSELSTALSMARREASLSAIDEAIGRVLDELEASGRAEHSMIAVVGLRGDLLPGARSETGPRLSPPVIEIPLAMRYPCGAAADLPERPLSLVDLPRRIAWTFGVELAPGRSTGDVVDPVTVTDPRFAITSTVTSDRLYERYVDGEVVAFDRAGQQVTGEDPGPVAEAAPGTAFEIRSVEWAPGFDLTWDVADGRMLPATTRGEPLERASRPPNARGGVRIPASTTAVELPLTRRGSAVRLGVSLPESIAPDSPDVMRAIGIGDTLASELPLLLAPGRDAPAVGDDEEPTVTLTRTNGLWWTLAVAGEGPAEVLITVWPPREPTDEFEVSAGGAVVAHAVAGRRDLVRLEGTAPFDLRIKKVGREDFALACRIGERFVAPHEVAGNGLLYGTKSSAEFLLFDWQPTYSARLPSVDAALYRRPESMDVPPAGAYVSLRRRAPGGAPGPDAALDDDGLGLVRMLPPGE